MPSSTHNTLTFIWDKKKYNKNFRKHHIHFIDTIPIFDDLYRLEELDKKNSINEIRYNTIGRVGEIIIHLSYTVRDENIRIISARKATKTERKKYEEGVN